MQNWQITQILIGFIQLFFVTSTAIAFEVIDGDTFYLDGQVIRLEGIDAPETAQTCHLYGREIECGKEASLELKRQLSSGEIMCSRSGYDAYERVLATCFAGDKNINLQMIESGWAWAFVKYSDAYIEQEMVAREHRLGLWAFEDAEAPWDFRDHRWQATTQIAPEGCPIKGNISRNGKIYHTPWSRWYDRTKVSVERGERWFCSEKDALIAGWRAPIGF